MKNYWLIITVISLLFLLIILTGCLGEEADVSRTKNVLELGENTTITADPGENITIKLLSDRPQSKIIGSYKLSSINESTGILAGKGYINDFYLGPSVQYGNISPSPVHSSKYYIQWENISGESLLQVKIRIPRYPDQNSYQYYFAAVQDGNASKQTNIQIDVTDGRTGTFQSNRCAERVRQVFSEESGVIILRNDRDYNISAVSSGCKNLWSFDVSKGKIVDLSFRNDTVSLLQNNRSGDVARVTQYPGGDQFRYDRYTDTDDINPDFRSVISSNSSVMVGGSSIRAFNGVGEFSGKINHWPTLVDEQHGTSLTTYTPRPNFNYSITDISALPNDDYLVCLETIGIPKENAAIWEINDAAGGIEWMHSFRGSECNIGQTISIGDSTIAAIDVREKPLLVRFDELTGITWIRTVNHSTGRDAIPNRANERPTQKPGTVNHGSISGLARKGNHLYIGGSRQGRQWLLRTDLQGHPERSQLYKKGEIIHLDSRTGKPGVRFWAIRPARNASYNVSKGIWKPH